MTPKVSDNNVDIIKHGAENEGFREIVCMGKTISGVDVFNPKRMYYFNES